jgi:hypothetical protein
MRYIPPKRLLAFNRLYEVISQNIVILITTAVRTSNPIEGIIVCFKILSQAFSSGVLRKATEYLGGMMCRRFDYVPAHVWELLSDGSAVSL